MRTEDAASARRGARQVSLPAPLEALAERVDWTNTPLGAVSGWSQALRTTVLLMLDSRQAMCLCWGPGLTLLYNDAYAPFLGQRHPAALGCPMADVWSDVWNDIAPLIDRALAGEAVRFEEFHLVMHRNGYPEETWWNFCYSPARDDDGRIVGMLNVASDATPAVLAKGEAVAERERQRRMLQQMPGFAAMLSGPEHRFSYVNDAYVDLSGPHDFIGRTVGELYSSLADRRIIGLLDDVYRTGTPFFERAMVVRFDRVGGERFIDILFEPIRDDANAVTGIFIGGYDVTDRVRAEIDQRESEQRYRTLFEAIDSGFCIIELRFDAADCPVDYRIVEANSAFERQTGLIGASGRWISELAPGLEPYWFETYGQVARTGEPVQFESEASVFGRWYEVHAYRSGALEQNRVAVLFNDITDRRRADLALRELNETLESRVEERTAERNVLAKIVESTDVMILVSDLDYNVMAINRANADEFERIYGVRPVVGDNMLDLLSHLPEEQAVVRSTWGRGLQGEEITVVTQHGATDRDRPSYEVKFRTLRDAQGTPVGCYQFVTDVTQRIRDQQRLSEAEDALRQSQKMEAMGQLTGGVAHDFNNLLTPIVGSLDLLIRRGIGGEREQRLIDGALQSAERAKTLVQRLLAFARRQPLHPVPVDVGALIDGMSGLIESTLGPAIDVRTALAPGLPPARADANQLEMALLNLAVNARDAMPDGGTLRLIAEQEAVGPDHPTALSPGAYIRVSIVDSGQGMDAATRSRAIEPFFSTKGIGKGTGLGLSMVHGLAAQLGGALTIKSALGAGTTIELWLPVSAVAPPEEASVPSVEVRPASTSPSRVLLVDDEPLVRLSTSNMLAELGYTVTEAGSAEDALVLLSNDASYGVVVTDHLMPGMTGAELARTVRTRWPALPVLLVSGYADLDDVASDLTRLAKPFRGAELAVALSQVMT
ncbi:PAS domain-containing hybrid sensor histidine kinase/response regulator [Sphingomonas sp. PAMC 26621]|uniref:PAS domain-containing hybrid sensor histidine kinase/response regulator n=1 Tax=Sphingomonas sp. PAMC 26621 TaxID=1112213 RepID=UPI0002885E8C|nr:PAS domain-containing protein [Sphingomonas sp. PAMC 26621]